MNNSEQVLRSRRMGEMPEGRLLLSMGGPMMLSMLVQAMYNVVDSIYVSRVAEDCLSALSLAFPAQNVMIGLATGTGVGVSTLVSRALGAGDRERANRVAGNSLTLCVFCWALMALFGALFSRAFIASQTDSAAIVSYGTDYLRIVTVGSVFLYFEVCFQRLLQSTGQTRLSMFTQMIGAVTNIILDPFFIYGWAGLPAMGTAGAALATIIGQGCGAVGGLFFNLRYNKDLRIRPVHFKPRWPLIARVYKIGFPSILMMAIGSLTGYAMNMILIGFTSTAVAVYGAYMKLQSFFFMPVFGINNAVIPIIGFNYGAGNRERILRTIRWGVIYAMSILTIGMILFLAAPGLLLSAFSASENMLRLGIPALRIISITFPVAGFCIVSGSACQALDRSMFSLIITILRQVVVLVPAAYLLSRLGNVDLIWWSFPIAEVMSMAASAFFLRRAMKVMEQRLADRQTA